jgi:hypothetical protein
MDTDSNKRNAEEKNSDGCADTGDIFQPTRVRCTLCTCDEVDRVILDHGRNILLPLSLLFWAVFLAFG